MIDHNFELEIFIMEVSYIKDLLTPPFTCDGFGSYSYYATLKGE